MSIESQPPKAPTHQWGNRVLLVLLTAVVLPIGTTLLYRFPPTEYAFLPCWLNWLTGYHCPGCGATRCVHAVLHGNLKQALAYNAMFVLLSPYLAYLSLGMAYALWTGRKPPGPRFPAWVNATLLAILFIYGIVRNIDVYPLNLLAPHQL